MENLSCLLPGRWRFLCNKPSILMKKLTLLLWFIPVLAALSSSAQRVTLSFENTPLEKVLREIKTQTGYPVIYNNQMMAQAKPVTIGVRNTELREALEVCFTGQPLQYEIDKTSIIIYPRQTANERSPVLTGYVLNEEDQPLEGVTVTEKKSGHVTVTNSMGFFSVKNVSPGSSLRFSFIGYEQKDISTSENGLIRVRLKLAIKNLDETVMIAYGKTSLRLNTGSVSRISGEELSKQPAGNILSALEGRIPGLNVTQTSGVPGAAVKMQIRGRNSIDQGSDPLFVIDGIPFAPGNSFLGQLPSSAGNPSTSPSLAGGLSPFNLISPADIESIEVLKDADATAIYGSRGANGVILITTRFAHSTKTSVNLSLYSGITETASKLRLLNTADYLTMRKEAFRNDSLSPVNIYADPDLLVWDQAAYTDFRKILTGNKGHVNDVKASVSSGGEQSQFLLGTNYRNETTVYPGNHGDKRTTAFFNFHSVSTDKKLELQFSASYTTDRNDLFATDLTLFSNLAPNYPALIDSTGNLNWSYKGTPFFSNPLSFTKYKYRSSSVNLLSGLTVSYTLAKALKLRASFGYNFISTDETSITPIAAQNPLLNPVGYSDFAGKTYKSWNAEPQLEYNSTINKLRYTILLGTSFQEQASAGTQTSASGFTSDNLLYSLNAAPVTLNYNNSSLYRYSAGFLRLNLNWQQKYIINLSARRDASSRFGPGNRLSDFWSGGAAWIFTNEKAIITTLPFLSFGKLRGSYGVTGNDQIGDYQFLESWAATQYPYNGAGALAPLRLHNDTYGWEKNRKLEAALELGFFKDRIFLTLSAYQNRCSNQLIGFSLPSQTGFTTVTRNFPATVQNRGLEIYLNTTNIATTNWKWTTSFNLTVPKNKLLRFDNIESTSYSYLEVGEPLSVVQGYHYTGIDPVKGIYSFEDKNKDGSISYPDDYFPVIANREPRFYGGLQNTVTWKGVSLDFFFEFRKQQGQNYLASYSSYVPGLPSNQPIQVLNRWTGPGSTGTVQKFTSGYNDGFIAASNLGASDAVYGDASYMRFKNLTISYELTKKFLQKIAAQSMKFFVMGQNLFTWTRYKAGDPEIQQTYRLPVLRTWAAGLNITF